MKRNEVIEILETLEWKLRHNIEPENPNFQNLNEEETECALSQIKDQLFYLKHTSEPLENIFDEQELEIYAQTNT